MPTFSRRRLLALRGGACPTVAVALALGAGCHAPQVTVVERDGGASGSPTPVDSRPRRWPVVVSIVIDQEAAWIADERWPLLPADGGLARLRREGTYAEDMRYAHAATDTAPGHAALYTGAPPRVSGVWANEGFDPASNEKGSILRDPASKLVTSTGPTASAGSAMGPLKVDTVADRFRTAHRDALIVSLSLKDRGAIFGGGRAPTVVLWYDRALDRFVTSDVLGGSFPAWAVPLVTPDVVRAEPWTLLDPTWVKSHAATPDAEPGEGELGGMPITFPHDVSHAASVATAFRGSPFADEALLGLALAAMSAGRAGERPTLVALSLSANDYVGHAFGPDSWEAWDELRRLDASLARFFAQLDARFGAAGWAALLTADHGVTTMPEAAALPAARPWCASGDAGSDRWERACGKVGRLMPDALTTELRDAAAKASPHGRPETPLPDAAPGARDPLVLGITDPYVYLTPYARTLPAPDLERVKKAVTAALLRHPEVDRVVDTSTLPETCPPESDESLDALVCRSFVPKLAGDFYVLVKRGSFFDPNVVPGKGASHGSPYLFDRAVPFVARSPGAVAPGRVLDAPISFRAFSRTLASLLGIEPPNFEAARALDLTKTP